jgi:hypothetical protein
VQSLHVPEAPHAFASAPVAHTPLGLQQPVAHGSVLQLAPQRPVARSQIWPLAQSPFFAHPHAPPTQA